MKTLTVEGRIFISIEDTRQIDVDDSVSLDEIPEKYQELVREEYEDYLPKGTEIETEIDRLL